MALTKKRRVFVEEYLRCWNAAEAARRAGYSERTARSQGQRLLTFVDVAAEIERRIQETAMSANEVLLRLAAQARGSIGDFVQIVNGTPIIDFSGAEAAGKMHLVKALAFDKDGELSRVELYDAQAALVHLGRYHKLFVDRVEHGYVDWQEELVRKIQLGQIKFEVLVDELGDRDLATRLFESAGVPVVPALEDGASGVA